MSFTLPSWLLVTLIITTSVLAYIFIGGLTHGFLQQRFRNWNLKKNRREIKEDDVMAEAGGAVWPLTWVVIVAYVFLTQVIIRLGSMSSRLTGGKFNDA